MRMKDFVINIGNIEKGIKKVFKESLYKCYVTCVVKEGRRSVKSRFALSLISEGIIEPKPKGETV